MQTSLDNPTQPHQPDLIKRILSILQSPLFCAIFVVAVTLAVFSPVLKADFVMWDDDIAIYQNPNLGGLSLERIHWAFTDVDSLMRYSPLTLLSWIITYQFFGLNPFGYHLVNWLLHGFSSGLLLLIIRNILLLSPLSIRNNNHKVHHRYINIIAAAATLFWALHPLRVEPVAWATDRTYCQAVFFLLLSTLCYMKAIDLEFDKRRYLFLIVSACIFYTASLFSHATGITYFAIYFILDVFLFKRIGNTIGWWKSQAAKKVVLEKLIFAIPAVLIGIISVAVRVKSAGVWETPVPISVFGITDRLMQAIYIIVYYIYRPFYPVDLAPVYSTLVSFDPLSLPFLLSALGLFVFSLVIFILRKQWPIGAALLLSHIILLIPVMGFFEHPHYPADRYSILSSISWSVFLAMALLYFKKKGIRTLFIACMISILCFWGVLSVKQAAVWNNSESLFSHTLQTLGDDPYKYDIYWRWGRYLYVKGRTDEAAQNFIKTLQIKPNHPDALYHLARIEYERGDLERAGSYYQRLMQVAPNYFRDNNR